jgi:lon-related putative ATP-dependent protease
MTNTIKELEAEKLRSTCNPDKFSFHTTSDLQDLGDMLGQERALSALKFGINMPNSGYNLFALGSPGTGKHTAVSRYLHETASIEPAPVDWVYVNNFSDSTKPVAIKLPAGLGKKLRLDMQQLIKELMTTIPAVFESDDYKSRIQEIDEAYEKKEEEAFLQLSEEASHNNTKVFKRHGSFIFTSYKNKKALDADSFKKLPEDEQKRINDILESLQAKLQDILQKNIPKWRKERRERIKQINDEVTLNAVGYLIRSLSNEYETLPEVIQYLDEVQTDVITNVDAFFPASEAVQGALDLGGRPPLQRYEVNLLVDHSDKTGSPVVYEDNPSYGALVGRVEHISQLGALITDFTLIKPGALHNANGGYLILEVRKLLTQPYAWEGLKRALYANEIRIESLAQALSLISTVSLEPQPIPLSVKVVLLGERLLYYLLCEYDPDFRELFKVAVDFEDKLERNEENDQLYAQLIATLARKDNLHPFDRTAVAAVIEQSMRMANDSEKLSAHMRGVADLLREASFWSRQAGRDVVQHEDVQRAIDYQIERADRIRDRMQEAILRDTVMIDTSDRVVGQVNGLSVIELGEALFGIPTRITATTRLGEGEVIDIEREVELGGPIHSKGVFILSSYLGAHYARDCPLSLSASVTFEQSYGEVEGDSASLAELCALLSSLANLPVNQFLAVTGSVNQHGQAQAVGGINEKIEGFFDICNYRGLTGNQGVIIPSSNAKYLMLRNEVVEAVRNGQFHVYPVDHINQAIELLTAVSAGQEGADGKYPVDSVNGKVQSKLRDYAGIRQKFSAPGEAHSNSTHNN